VVQVDDQVGGLCSMSFGVQFDGVKLGSPIGFPTWGLLNGRVDHLLELADGCLFEIEVMEDEVLGGSEFEGLDHPDGERCI